MTIAAPPPAPSIARRVGLALPAHHRVFAGFFLYAFGMGGFHPRLGELQRTMGMTEGQLGLGLIGGAVGTLLALTVGGRLIERIGHRRILLSVPVLIPMFYALAAHARGPLSLFLILLPAGLVIGAIEVAVNLEADRVEHQHGRRIMNRAHAFWSFGFFGASLVGMLSAWIGIPPAVQLALMVPLSLGLMLLLLGRMDVAPPRPSDGSEPAPHFAMPTLPILALVALSFSALVLEGAAFDWSAIYMRDAMQAAPWVGALAVATSALAQATTRYLADTHVERHSPRVVARTLLTVLGCGTLLVFAAPHPALALLGFAMIGIGTSVMFPLAMSAAAQRTDRPAAVNVAALAQIGFVSFMLAPPLLGFVAEHAGVRWSYGVALPLVVLSLAVTGALRGPPK